MGTESNDHDRQVSLRLMAEVMTNQQSRGTMLIPKEFVSPGQHPYDQASSSGNPVDYQLERLSTYIRWSVEHLSAFKRLRQGSPDDAESELGNLDDSVRQAFWHLKRLTELLQHGYQTTESLAATDKREV